MRGIPTLLGLAALLALAGVAAAQSPCPECDPDGASNANNSYHSVDAGAVLRNGTNVTDEVLVDTDSAHSHEGDSKGLWLWFALCLSVFVEQMEELLGVHTDADANAEVYAESDGVDVDASVTGLQQTCDDLKVNATCAYDFDDSELGGLDGQTWETMSEAEETLGTEIFAPAILPDTGDTRSDVCVEPEAAICG